MSLPKDHLYDVMANSATLATFTSDIYPVAAPQAAMQPYIVYREADGFRHQGMSSTTGLVRAIVEFSCHASDARTADLMAQEIRNLFDHYGPESRAGFRIDSMTLIGEFEEYYSPVDSHDIRDYVTELEFLTHYREDAPTHEGTVYYVDATLGSDTNDGSEATPWQSLARVEAETYNKNDVVLFRRGEVWTGTLTLGTRSDLTIGAYGTGDLPRIDANQGGVAVGISGCTNVTVERIHADNAQFYGIKVDDGCDGIRIVGCRGTNSQVGIQVFDEQGTVSNDIEISNCVCFGNTTHGIGVLEENNRLRILYNECYDNSFVQVDFLEAGIKLKMEPAAAADDVEIRGNVCYRNYHGFYIDTLGQRLEVVENHAYENSINGMVLEDTDDALVARNVCENNGDFGLSIFRGCHRVTTENNTVVNNLNAGLGVRGGNFTAGNGDGGGMVDNLTRDNRVFGNQFAQLVCSDGGDNIPTGVSGGSGNRYERNDLGPEQPGLVIWGGVNYSTYAAWQAQDPTNIVL